MINLLPDHYKEEISYSRRNTRLRSWITKSVFALFGVGLIIGGGALYMQSSIMTAERQAKEAQAQLEAQRVEETQKKVEEISGNTKLALQVLSREVLFSKLIKQIGSALPANTALETLEIDAVQGGLQLNAGAADFTAGTQIQLNLQDPKNGVFEKADINSINCENQVSAEKRYPCTVSLRALFSKNNTYLYITPTTGVKQ